MPCARGTRITFREVPARGTLVSPAYLADRGEGPWYAGGLRRTLPIAVASRAVGCELVAHRLYSIAVFAMFGYGRLFRAHPDGSAAQGTRAGNRGAPGDGALAFHVL